MDTNQAPTLYGIFNSNRKPEDFWGKNQFNSSFPVALACYMRDRKIPAQYVHLSADSEISVSEVPFDAVFNSRKRNSELSFMFESKFNPYQKYAKDDIKNIDLVICDGDKQIRALEIKLTALPDETTYSLEEKEWGCELVIRPASTSYAALGIYHHLGDDKENARHIVEHTAGSVRDWNNPYEVSMHFDKIINSLKEFQSAFLHKQQPFLMQTVWKTKGKKPYLAENAFDIFIWSDYALCRLFMGQCRADPHHDLTRYERSTARFARFLYEALTRGFVKIKSIYTEMTFDKQTDKEFAANGRLTNPFLSSERLVKPAITTKDLYNIIQNGGESLLSPERRLDQSIYIQALLDKKVMS